MNFPSKCPYCGKDIIPNKINKITELNSEYDSCQTGLTLELHKCIHCQKSIFVVKEEYFIGDNCLDSKIIFNYPTTDSIDISNRIKNLSPTAYKTYQQTIKAKAQGLDMLVGAGLRIALEWLVWDYLLKIKELSATELKKLKLYQRIEKMNGNFYSDVCAKLIRLFGNDSVHIVQQLEFSVEEVIEAFEFLCALIDSELKVKEINERLPKFKKT